MPALIEDNSASNMKMSKALAKIGNFWQALIGAQFIIHESNMT